MNMYEGVLEFKGNWRTYQKRILDRADRYLEDGKIHIVAAPGSGKTTLGIELIRRQGAPCLILSPSITIRQQWISRMEEGFLAEGKDGRDWFSNSVKKIRPVMAITYQALYSCMELTPIREIRLLPEAISRLWDGRVPERPVCRMRW